MSDDQTKNLFIGSVITSVIGGILILFTDFAGWYNYTPAVRTWSWVTFESNILSMIGFGAAAAALFYCTYLSVLMLGFPDKRPSQYMIQIGFYAALAVFILSLGGGIYFIIDMLMDEPTDWWLGEGFYGGTIGGGLTALFFHLALRTKSV